MKWKRTDIKDQRGQAMVEFALILPVLLFVSMMIIDMGRALMTYAQISAQVRNGLRHGVIRGYETGARNYLDCDGMHDIVERVFFANSLNASIYYIDADAGNFPNTTYLCPDGITASQQSNLDAVLDNGDLLRIDLTPTVELITPFFPFDLTFTLSGQRTLVKDITLYATPLPPAPGTDYPPNVEITYPVDLDTVASFVLVSANASDDVGIDYLEFFIDGTLITTDTDATDGWGFSWNTTSYSDGSVHTIGVTAYDTSGQTKSHSIAVTVDNAGVPSFNTAPTVTVTGPASPASGVTSMTADASDDSGVNKVDFYLNGAWYGADTDGSNGWSVGWDTTGLADGTYTLQAYATDTNNVTSVSANYSVSVDNVAGDSPPQITLGAISSPAAGSVALSATTVDGTSPVTQVEFFVDGISQGIDADGTDGWNATWDTTGYSNSDHTVVATATDSAAQSSSDSALVTVRNPVVIPLQADGVKVAPDYHAQLTWSGATTGAVSVYRRHESQASYSLITVTDNDGEYTDPFPSTEKDQTYWYYICEYPPTGECSNEDPATLPR